MCGLFRHIPRGMWKGAGASSAPQQKPEQKNAPASIEEYINGKIGKLVKPIGRGNGKNVTTDRAEN